MAVQAQPNGNRITRGYEELIAEANATVEGISPDEAIDRDPLVRGQPPYVNAVQRASAGEVGPSRGFERGSVPTVHHLLIEHLC